MNYEDFLETKTIRANPKGKTCDISDVNDILFDFQKDIVKWSVGKGRCAIFADTGLGKTFMQLEWARLIDEKTLIIAPLSVARQTVREAQKISVNVQYVRRQDEMTGNISITNYEMIEHFDLSQFGAIVLDECFVSDTPVDTIEGTKIISEIKEGDMIYTAAGLRRVQATTIRYKDSLALTSIQGRDVISSSNHLFFTRRGWVRAIELREGDYVIYTTEAMRMVQDKIDRETNQSRESILRSILFSEMEDETAGNSCQSSHEGSPRTNRQESKRMVKVRQSDGQGSGRTYQDVEPYTRPAGEEKNITDIAGNGAQAKDTRRQWSRADSPAEDAIRCFGSGMDTGICSEFGQEDSRISHTLQDRYSEQGLDGSYRDRWLQSHSRDTKSEGCEEGCEITGARVDSVKIYKSDDPIFLRYRDATDRVALYDLQIDGHPSFSVHGLLVHNSSILKALSGKTRKKLTELCQNVPYRLCCTATPAPNDYTELGNHVEFLGICKASEMLAMFFINANYEHTIHIDGKAYRKKGSNKGGQEWRLKHHAEEPFFRWMATWAMAIIKPSDLGYDDDGFILPELRIRPEFVKAEYQPEDQLFFTHIKGIKDAAKIRRDTAPIRLEKLKEIISNDNEQWIIWCGLNEESSLIAKNIDGTVEVKGNDSPEFKAQAFEDFQDGKIRILVSKPTIAGFGMNFQNAHRMAFFGLNYSWEQYYQCIRREWRYRQTHPVDVYIIMSEIEESIYKNIMRKDAQAKRLRGRLIDMIKSHEIGELTMDNQQDENYIEKTIKGDGWTAMLGDSCKRIKELDAESIHLSVHSPPFEDLFTYTATSRDLGNSRSSAQFFEHYRFIIAELLRITKPGRLACVHTSDIPAMANRDGYIGVKDFPGSVIDAYEQEGWIFVGRAFVQKNPQAQAIRTKAKSLLFVQLAKDSAHSRPALIDQILLFKKPGENETPITPVENGELDNETWINWANGIWIGISESDTLQYSQARGEDDEKHICPLQLGTIERCIKLWSNPGEMVYSPFMGIGSEGYVAIMNGREFIGCELKPEYYDMANKNLDDAYMLSHQVDMFAMAGIEV